MSVDDKFVTECLSKIDQIVKISRNAITAVSFYENVLESSNRHRNLCFLHHIHSLHQYITIPSHKQSLQGF